MATWLSFTWLGLQAAQTVFGTFKPCSLMKTSTPVRHHALVTHPMSHDRFVSASGRAISQPRLATLIARRAGLILQRDRLNAQIRTCEDAIRRHVHLNETAVARKDDEWFVVQVISNPEDHVDEKLAKSMLRPSTLKRITKVRRQVTLSIRKVSEGRAREIAFGLSPSPVTSSK